jgi:hypothetical protein
MREGVRRRGRAHGEQPTTSIAGTSCTPWHHPSSFPRPLGLPAALECLEQALSPFQLFVLLQQDRHDNGLERPRA